jgi:hypothetical protein
MFQEGLFDKNCQFLVKESFLKHAVHPATGLSKGAAKLGEDSGNAVNIIMQIC